MASKTVVAAKPRTVADFRNSHDRDVIVPTKIRAGLTKLLEIGPEHYEYDEGFRALCGLQAAQLAAYRGQFVNHWFMTPGVSGGKGEKRVWFGNAKVAARLRTSPPDAE
jgi:hypothetical protein